MFGVCVCVQTYQNTHVKHVQFFHINYTTVKLKVTSLSVFTFMHWRRKWQPTPVFLPGESQGWGHTESDMTEVT